MKRIERTVSGGCQCGAVRFRATALLDNAHLCHCRMCQKATGGPFAALVAAPKDALVWTRGTPAAFTSSDRVERGFCAACGTPLFFNNLNNDRINLMIGAFDTPDAFPPKTQMSTESRVAWFGSLADLHDLGATDAGGDAAWAAAIKASKRQHPDHDTEVWPE